MANILDTKCAKLFWRAPLRYDLWWRDRSPWWTTAIKTILNNILKSLDLSFFVVAVIRHASLLDVNQQSGFFLIQINNLPLWPNRFAGAPFVLLYSTARSRR